MKHHLLLVDDEKAYYDTLNENFSDYTISYAANFSEAKKAMDKHKIDLILMDWNLGSENGLDIVQKLKASLNTFKIPVIMLTGNKQESDVVEALNQGADDYVTKPFKADLLISKINANLRKYGLNKEKNFTLQNVNLDEDNFSVTMKGSTVKLRRKEFMMFKFMILNPDKCFTRKELNESTSGKGVYVSERSIDTLIRYLREKIGEESIKTIHGQGYKLNTEHFKN